MCYYPASMKRSDFHYDLPEELIAQHPAKERTASRLLVVNPSGQLAHRKFNELPRLFRHGDLLVRNNTRVIPARLHGHKASGGRVEVMVERLLSPTRLLARVRASRSPAAGTAIMLDNGSRLEVRGREGEFFLIDLPSGEDALSLLDALGNVPLPPYIQRLPESRDLARYQTVYANVPGAVAAPTAGLHFDRQLLDTLVAGGVEIADVTLHVGAGTFQPVRVENIDEHQMHAERLVVEDAVVRRINSARAAGRRIIAVGTTTVRSLESAAQSGELKPFDGESRLFIKPGYRFRVVDGMITNFHLPASTLMMLVSAFAGHETIMAAYREAVARRYRFFSYGDAMLLWRES